VVNVYNNRAAPLVVIVATLAVLAGPGCRESGEGEGAGVGADAGAAGPAAPAVVELKDVDGNGHRPLDLNGAKASVVLFVRHDCPVSNGYAPEIGRIIAAYAPRGARFYLVHVDPDLSPRDAAAHAKAFSYPVTLSPVLIDGKRELVAKLGATVTPEAVVVVGGGVIAYRGRIDDKYYAYGKSRPEPTVRDLRAALDSLLEGKPPPVDRTTAIGCPIE
jgi:hypothetical protein